MATMKTEMNRKRNTNFLVTFAYKKVQLKT